MLRKKFGKNQETWSKSHDFEFEQIKLIKSISTSDIKNGDTFTFLNLSKDFKEGIDWNYSAYGKLWTYNLNYFDWLQQEGLEVNTRFKSIKSYINNLKNLKDGLEPFPISLRLMNWMKFVLYNDIDDENINNAIVNQAIKLEDNLEFHLLGNHLLENFFTLVCFSVFIGDENRFTNYSKSLLEQLEEQILEDGGHFELSPMYHQIMLFRLLDTINFIKGSPFYSKNALQELEKKAAKMLSWLDNMTFKSGDIPLFNDSAFKIAPTTTELVRYASDLGIKYSIAKKLTTSGYRRIENGQIEMILDVGSIGPDYIPGHAHSDMLSFEMQYNKKPFIVDTGLSTYEIGKDRDRERATASHNTVVVNDRNQTQVWGGFRVAQRASIKVDFENENEIIASHDGYKHFGIRTRRSFQKLRESILIKDNFIGNDPKTAQSFIHFHPDIDVTLADEICKTNLGTLTFKNAVKISIESYLYAPAFNTTVEAKKLVISFNNNLEINIY